MARNGDILLHSCCCVCFGAAVGALREEGMVPVGYFYNPNIHPFQESRKRLRAAEVAAEILKIEMKIEGEYGLDPFVKRMFFGGKKRFSGGNEAISEEVFLTEKSIEKLLEKRQKRCSGCYEMRLEATAERAAKLKIGTFTTTLLASSHQERDAIMAAGRLAGEMAGVRFLERDWRDRLGKAGEWAKKHSLYRQQYCGCIWSEYERFGPWRQADGGE